MPLLREMRDGKVTLRLCNLSMHQADNKAIMSGKSQVASWQANPIKANLQLNQNRRIGIFWRIANGQAMTAYEIQ